jgi:hypothetical protein
MHAVLLTTTIDPERAGEAQSLLARDVVPRVKEAPGLVAAYWMRSDDRKHGTSVIIFEASRLRLPQRAWLGACRAANSSTSTQSRSEK